MLDGGVWVLRKMNIQYRSLCTAASLWWQIFRSVVVVVYLVFGKKRTEESKVQVKRSVCMQWRGKAKGSEDSEKKILIQVQY